MSYSTSHDKSTIPLIPVAESEYSDWLKNTPARHRAWLESNGFNARAGTWCGMPDSDGKLEAVAFGMTDNGWLYQLAGLPRQLPPGNYRLVSVWNEDQRIQACLGWGLGAYQFERYTSQSSKQPVLCLDEDIAGHVTNVCDAQSLVRDLINTPTEDLGPGELADAAIAEARRFGARHSVIVGDKLLNENFPAIHVVGRAAEREPRLVRVSWGEKDAPVLALVGKGVCFDTGGLNMKNATGMSLMKKDMGGAAHVIALARLVMQYKLPVRLELLIPAVENNISGNAYRPGDVISTRKGLHVEIGNTDAEGRIVLADALAFACEKKPDLVIDFATLTGAARIALGADLPPVFSNHIEIARAIEDSGERVEDPLWVMPLYQPYKELFKSDIADFNNIAKTSYGGCIIAALFLEQFVEKDVPWVHIDTFGWNQSPRPGRPAGGEALGLRAVFNYLRERYN